MIQKTNTSPSQWVQVKGTINKMIAMAEPQADALVHDIHYDFTINGPDGSPIATISHVNAIGQGFEVQLIVKKSHVVPVAGHTNN